MLQAPLGSNPIHHLLASYQVRTLALKECKQAGRQAGRQAQIEMHSMVILTGCRPAGVAVHHLLASYQMQGGQWGRGEHLML
jgi:hypothetical protein